MNELREALQENMPLTVGETISFAEKYHARVVDVVLLESELRLHKPREEILEKVMEEYAHNLKALDIGLENGESILLGTAASQLNKIPGHKCFTDPFLDNALLYTLAAQVGNHCVGLRPCAGTGDSCPYAGFIKAMMTAGADKTQVAEIAALILKIGGIFRVGKITTGCNMEGFGAGAACTAAATVALEGGSPEQMGKAMVLALSPTIANPCTPRVLVPALCATQVGGAILIGMYAARLCMLVDMTVNVPIDVMIAMASEVHVASAKYVVPTVVDFMEPFFKRKANVETLVGEEVKAGEKQKIEETLARAQRIAKDMAKGAAPILSTFGDAVVGGSSQAVGSPTNAARIAHELARGKIQKITVELYPELFARRAINIPGVLMGAVFGATTGDYDMYKHSVDKVIEMGIAVDIKEGSEYGIQKITIETDAMNCMVDTLNRGGGRLTLRDALPSLAEARAAAEKLGIVLV
jgi:L-serine dehydratase